MKNKIQSHVETIENLKTSNQELERTLESIK